MHLFEGICRNPLVASAEAAHAATGGPQTYPRDDARVWTIENVTVFEQVASA